ncbi:MAG TPA: Lrp/AsnC family transcriptional regulator [Candidatus Thermoplasmatota archaeon]|nr:Lrp/AsnC family transcriptional regulator [Candidatus Thermoplasmatota archaeon]
MAKNSREQIDKDERKVLAEIQKNSNQNIDTIAKHCGFSRQKVWRTIKHLEDNKTIWGYTAVADEEAEGLKHFALLVKRNTIPFDVSTKNELIFENLDDYLPGVVKIDDIFFTHGSFDAVVTFYTSDLASAKKFIREILKRVGKYIKEILLLETIIPIRKKGIKNPHINKLVEYL